jgi:putative membrane protein
MMYGYGWGGMGWGMLLFWGLFIVLVVAVVRGLGNRGGNDAPTAPPPPAPGASALDILAQRYARGEIDREEFEQKRRDLERL